MTCPRVPVPRVPLSRVPASALALLLVACAGPGGKGGDGADSGVRAIVDPSRPEHFFDHPFPSEDLHRGADGRPDLSGFPEAPSELTAPVIAGWARRIEAATLHFANHGAAYLRFEGPLPALPAQTEGLPTDPVLLVDLDTGELLPLELRFIEDPAGDPFFAPNTLALAPQLGHPPRPGARLAAVVMAAAGAAPAAGWSAPDGLAEGLAAAGVDGEVAVATVFQTQAATDELRLVRDDLLARLGDDPDWTLPDGSAPRARRLTGLAYAQGTTPSGEAATVCTVTFAGGEQELRYLAPLDGGVDFALDLDADWPMEVYQVEIPTWNYSGLDDAPYMSPGFAHLYDTERETGWWRIDPDGGVGAPDPEPLVLSVSLPRVADGAPRSPAPVMIWDHGTGGHAYNVVQRRNPDDDGRALAQAWADAGWAVIGRDQPLYGSRYPLIDEGYGASLGFYNIVNLPAFRDNQRQGAIEGVLVRRFVQTALSDLLPDGALDPSRLRRGGHSLGSVTTHLGIAADPGVYEAAFVSGSGGLFTHYFLDTGLLDGFDAATLAGLFALFQAEAPDPVTPAAALGAALGLPEPAWARIDRLHPAITLFQWTMDGGDPMAIARDVDLPVTMIIGPGDLQVPDFTSDALLLALPDAVGTRVEARGDYDPHSVLYREPEGVELLRAWLADGAAR